MPDTEAVYPAPEDPAGPFLYFAYGYRHSVLRRRAASPSPACGT